MRRLVPALFVAVLLSACSESPTAPDATAASGQGPSFSVALPGTSTAISSASCGLVSSSKGDVLCNYSISNPGGLQLNVIPAAIVDIAYQCQNAGTGKVMSTGTDRRWVDQPHLDVTATTYSATDEALPTATVYTSANHKLNPCKGRQSIVVTSYSLVYWEVRIEHDLTSVCAGLDGHLGCQVL
jgi:hypothetical protein